MGKSKHRITNRPEYHEALINRGSLTFWIDEQELNLWCSTEHHVGRGRGFQYSNTVIETALMLKGLFNLPLWALEGFLNSVFSLMNVQLSSPGYSCISKRAVKVNYRNTSRGAIAHLVVDATGVLLPKSVEPFSSSAIWFFVMVRTVGGCICKAKRKILTGWSTTRLCANLVGG